MRKSNLLKPMMHSGASHKGYIFIQTADQVEKYQYGGSSMPAVSFEVAPQLTHFIVKYLHQPIRIRN